MEVRQVTPDQVRPIGRIFVEMEPLPEMFGLIHLPFSKEGKHNATRTGKIVGVSPWMVDHRDPKKPKRIKTDPDLKPGVRIMFGFHIGEEIQIDGKDYRFVSDFQIHGILEGDAVPDPDYKRG